MKMFNCPHCNKRMVITRLVCPDCDIVIKGKFDSHRFDYLDSDILDFMEVFVLTRGNIKDIEKELGISYPTVRNKIDRMVEEVSRLKELSRKMLMENQNKIQESTDKENKIKEITKKI